MNLLTPGFLVAGLLLAAIPLVIHFLNRRRFREQQWAAMDFLLRAMKKNRKRLRFEQWLLLTVRCLLLALLGLALARPMGCGGDTLSGLARQSGLHVLVLDDSYSMGYERLGSAPPGAAGGNSGTDGGGGTHFERAKSLALASVDRLTPGGDAVAVVAAGSPARIVFAPGYDLDAAKAAISRMDLSARSTDLPGALRLAAGIARDGRTQPLRHLRVLSDATRSSLEPSAGGGSESVRQAAALAAAEFSLVSFHHLGNSDQRHAAVLDVFPRSSLLTIRQGQELAAMVRAFGPDEQRTIQWSLDDTVLPGGGEVRVSTSGDEVVLGSVRLDRAGARVLALRLSGSDRLTADTLRRRVIDIADRVRVLVVEGERGGGVLSSSGAFLNVALAPTSSAGGSPTPGGPLASNSPLEPESISDLELPGKVLADYRVVILAGVGQLAEATADQLKAFVEQGGVLIVFAGEPVSTENYNRVLLPRGLLPGALVKRVSAAPDPAGSDALRFDFRPSGNLHPMLVLLRGEERSGLDTAQVYTYLQVEMSAATAAPPATEGVSWGTPGSTTPQPPQRERTDGSPRAERADRVLNFTQTGDPAITTHPLGLGRVVFVATSAGADGWTALPGKPVFVTLIQEMIATSVPPSAGWMNVLVGGRLELPPGLRLSAAPTLTDASGRTFAVVAEAAPDGQTRWRSEELNRPGVYLLSGVSDPTRPDGTADSPATLTLPIVVNVDAQAEADVRTVDEQGLRAALGGIELEVLRDQLPDTAADSDSLGADFGWAILIALLAFVGFESVMAMRFGRRG